MTHASGLLAQNGTVVVGDHPLDSLGSADIRIRVDAYGLNRADLAQIAGAYPPPPGASPHLGLECAGVIDDLGADARQAGFASGQRVCALLAGGGSATFVHVPHTSVIPVPKEMSLEQAAGFPEVYATAWINLVDLGGLRPHHRVVVHAGASGLGLAAAQLCGLMGARVVGTTRTATKTPLIEKHGASAVVVSDPETAEGAIREALGGGADLVLDPVGGSYAALNMAILNTDGRWILIGLMGGLKADVSLGLMLVKRLSLIGSTLRALSVERKAHVITAIRERMIDAADGAVCRPVIDATYPFEEFEAAYAAMHRNQNAGKIVLIRRPWTD